MKSLRSFYKTSSLRNVGVFLLWALAFLLVAGKFLIPAFKVKQIEKQILTLNGLNVKYNDDPQVSHFLQSIKENKGYLCLGTSEASTLSGGNYYDFLNNDSSIAPRFSILYGAGRTCGTFIPLLLHHRNEVKSLKIIYFINPVYWRTDLVDVNLEYWTRYISYGVCRKVELSEKEKSLYFKPVEAYFDKLNVLQKASLLVEYFVRNLRKSYFQDLRLMFYPEEYDKSLYYISPEKTPLLNYPNFGRIDTENVDTTWNVLKSFHSKDWFKSIDTANNYRYEELATFISLCKNLGIETTFVVGPINGRFIQNYDPASLKAYQETANKIKQLLITKEATFIDASDISFTPGAFNDHQHHSSYGAFLIYQKVKSRLK